MWEIISLALAGLSLLLLAWLVVLLARLKKIRFRVRTLAREAGGGEPALKIGELRERVRVLESGYRFFFEESFTYNVLVDREGRVLDMNRAFLNIFDREKTDLAGRPLSDLVAPGDREGFAGFLEEHQSDAPTPEREVEFVGPRGTRRILFGERHLKVGKAGGPAGVLLSGIDVTDRRRVEADERNLKRKLALSARMEALGIMAGGIAHDLKNLFNPVLSYPDYISDKLPPESDLREPVKRIKRAAAQASELVQNFLALARRGRLEMHPLDLNEVVLSYTQSMGCRTLEERFPRARLQVDLADKLPEVLGLSAQLNSVLMNLVKNGCEAMAEGGEVRVSTFAKKLSQPHRGRQQIPRGEYVVLKVEDLGKGMSGEELDRLFTPFASGKAMGTSGTGLGLVVVAGVIEDHHGYIDVESEPGRGTAFMIYLRALPAKEGKRVQGSGRGERILVVDDNPDDRREFTRELSVLGYEVAEAADGESALRCVRENPVDLLLMDLMLDRESGLDLYRRILEIVPEIRCVMVSGGLDYRARERATDMGITGFLDKPVTGENLANLIRDELKKSRPGG